jgi:alpha-ketoglutarate-dependent taurine dioxygenase
MYELGEADARPEDISVREFGRLINTHGVVRISGVTDSRYLAISDHFGCNWNNFNWTEAEPWCGGPVNKKGRIESSSHELPPHSEYTGHPVYPRLLWLYCVESAIQGGETVLYDGLTAAREMPAELRDIFAGQFLRSNIQRPLAAILDDYSVADADELRLLIRERGWGANLSIDDSLVNIKRKWPAFTRHAESDAEIFCNSIIFNAEFSLLVRVFVRLFQRIPISR